ncbi:hypothetical protein Z971_12215 [Enterococcus faecium VRE0576]|nr:hypothetical protein Z971_12215 [Enterococcus faecium VRE0576]
MIIYQDLFVVFEQSSWRFFIGFGFYASFDSWHIL